MDGQLSFTVTGVSGEMKIRDYLKGRLGFSTSLIAKVKYDMVSLNGTPVHMRAAVRDGDVITVTLPDEESENIEPMDIPIEIIYEDRDILAVNKPINMPTHPSRGNHLPTLANAVIAHLGAGSVFRAITRLDRDTSGIVLIAKNQLAAARLSGFMKSGRIEKYYYARTVGVPRESSGRIDLPIERECEGSIKRVVREDGKRALTLYRVIANDGESSLVELRPITGRTHQLRVHMAHIGCPLYADFLYGERVEGATYQLHCGALIFPHPSEEKTVTLFCGSDTLL